MNNFSMLSWSDPRLTIEGIDVVGRVVSASGVDAEKLLKKCIAEANSIKAQTKNLTHVLQEPLRGKE